MSIGNKIKTLRKEHGWTQEQLAKKLTVLQPHLNRWETNKAYPSLDAIKKLARLFNVSIDTLVLDEKDTDIGDKNLLGKIQGFEELDLKEQEMIANLIDSLLKKQNKNHKSQKVKAK